MSETPREQRIQAMGTIMTEARQNQEDIGIIVAAALHDAAEKLGGEKYLVTGRPGSWEAGIVMRMAAIGGSVTDSNKTYVERLAPLFVEMGQAAEDGGETVSLAMGQAVDALGSLKAFVGESRWYWDIANIGCQCSEHWEEFSQMGRW